MNENKAPEKKNKDGGVLSWILIVVLLNVLPPAGVILLIAKLMGHDLLGKLFRRLSSSKSNSGTPGSSAGGKYYSTFSSSTSRGVRNGQSAGPDQIHWEKVSPQSEPASAETPKKESSGRGKKKTTEKDDGITHISRGKNALFYCGWILLALSILIGIDDISNGEGFWTICSSAATMFGSIGMLYTAHSKDKKEQLYQNCVRIVGDKACYDLNALAKSTGLKPKKLERELNEMLERHYFDESAYIDKARGQLVLNREYAEAQANTVYQAAEQQREQDKYDLLLQELERACQRIQDRELLEKTVQIRGLTAAIFHAVRVEPEKENQITSFLNYYFPTTLKLLDSYADIEAKGYQGEKLSQTGERIKGTADTLITAYQKQLDNLYLHDALNLDADIDVLETMLKRDGLSGSDFKSEGTPGGGI